MHTVYFSKRKVETPSAFNELSRGQLLRVVEVMHTRGTWAEKTAAYTLILLKIKKRLWLAWLWLFRIGAEAKAEVTKITAFLFEPPHLTVNKLPRVKVGRWWQPMCLYGPKDGLGHIVFMEFVKAETYYLAYRKHLKAENAKAAEKALDALIAVLYRPKRKKRDAATFNGDQRQPYNDDRVAWLCAYAARLHAAEKQAILLFYLSCRDLLIRPFTHLYREQPQAVFSNGQEEVKSDDWLSAIYALADGALNMEKVAMLDARLALYDLDRRIAAQSKVENG